MQKCFLAVEVEGDENEKEKMLFIKWLLLLKNCTMVLLGNLLYKKMLFVTVVKVFVITVGIGMIAFSYSVYLKLVGHGGKKGAVERCPNCKGSGMQLRIQHLGPGMVQQIQSVCGECHGQGERINAKDRCKICLGKKVKKNLSDNVNVM